MRNAKYFACVGSDLIDLKIISSFLVVRHVRYACWRQMGIAKYGARIWDPGMKQHVDGISASVCLAQ